MPSDDDLKPSEALAAIVFLAVIGYTLFVISRAIYYRFSPPATVSLVASLEPAPTGGFGLHVVGGVQRQGKPSNGVVLLSVRRLWEGSAQEVQVAAAAGKFELAPGPQFTFASRNERLLIRAEAWTAELPNRPAEAEVYLNASTPVRYQRVIWGLCAAALLLLVIGFTWMFTGQASPFKNRIAIAFSYCIMLLFLAIPMTVADLVLILRPEILQWMDKVPVGIVIAKPWGAKPEEDPQWVLNIGGHVKPLATPAAEAQAGANPAGADSNRVSAGGANSSTANPPAAPADSNPTTAAPANSGAANATLANPAAASGAPPGSGPGTSAPEGTLPQPREVEGGIAVPFYVLVLAVIGGAINMARQVPKYHQEGERSVIDLAQIGKAAAAAVQRIRSGKSRGGSAKEEEEESEEEDDPSSERRLSDSNWRKGLLDQYMFLISAPFLAIITYFLLAWLGTTTVPALVLVSFSVGLSTEPIVQKIVEAAQSIFGKKKDDKAAVKGQQATKKRDDAEGQKAAHGPSEPAPDAEEQRAKGAPEKPSAGDERLRPGRP